jgi:thiamine-phosphate pyrophosphorylase
MDPRQPLPRRWLMTDERLGARLSSAIGRLPDGGGVVFRHYSLAPAERRELFEQVKKAACERGLLLLLAGSAQEAQAWGADGSHGRGAGAGLRTAPAHDLAGIRAAEQAGAALIFLSPVFETRSHPGAAVLGPERFDELAAQTKLPSLALGGMTEERFGRLRNAYGWAAIDAWASEL